MDMGHDFGSNHSGVELEQSWKSTREKAKQLVILYYDKNVSVFSHQVCIFILAHSLMQMEATALSEKQAEDVRGEVENYLVGKRVQFVKIEYPKWKAQVLEWRTNR